MPLPQCTAGLEGVEAPTTELTQREEPSLAPAFGGSKGAGGAAPGPRFTLGDDEEEEEGRAYTGQQQQGGSAAANGLARQSTINTQAAEQGVLVQPLPSPATAPN